MLKRVHYRQGKRNETLIADEGMVKRLFKGNYLRYLRYRLKAEDVTLVKTENYQTEQKPVPVLFQSHLVNKTAAEEEKEMREIERKMTIQLGVETMASYKQKKERT